MSLLYEEFFSLTHSGIRGDEALVECQHEPVFPFPLSCSCCQPLILMRGWK